MALHRQGVGTAPLMNGIHKVGSAQRLHEHLSIDHEDGVSFRLNGFPQGESSSVAGRSMVKGFRGRRFVRAVNNRECAVGIWVAVLICAVSFSLLLSYYLFSVGHTFIGDQDSSGSNHLFGDQVYPHDILHHRHERSPPETEKHFMTSGFQNTNSANAVEIINNKATLNRNRVLKTLKHNDREGTRSKLHFGFDINGRIGHRDSRDWDSDDRKREPIAGSLREGASHSENGQGSLLHVRWIDQQLLEKEDASNEEDSNKSKGEDDQSAQSHNENSNAYKADENGEGKRTGARVEDRTNESLGLYNERGRQELRKYEEQFEANLRLDLEHDSQKDQAYRMVSADALEGQESDDEASEDDLDAVEGRIGKSKMLPNFRTWKR